MKAATEQFFQARSRTQRRKRVGARTTANLRYSLDRIEKFYRTRPCGHDIAAMTRNDVEDFLDDLMNSGVSASYAGALLRCLRGVVLLAVANGAMPTNPTEALSAHRDRPGTKKNRVHLHEFELALAHVPVEFWMGLVLMRVCGLRPAEAFGLRVRHIDLEFACIEIHEQGGRGEGYYDPWADDPDAEASSSSPHTKSRRPRTVPLPRFVIPFVRCWIAERVADPITGVVDPDAFIAWPNLARHRGSLNRASAAWRAAAIEIGMTETLPSGALKASMHALRYSFGCDTQNDSRIPKSFVVDILGHDHVQDATVADRNYNVHVGLTRAEKQQLGEWGAAVGEAVLRNSEAGDIMPRLIERLLAAPLHVTDPMLGTINVGRLLGVSPLTVASMAKDGDFPGARLESRGGQLWMRIPLSGVEAAQDRLRDHITAGELADRTGYTRSTIHELAAKGVIPAPARYRGMDVWTREQAEKAESILLERQAERSMYRTLAEAAEDLGVGLKVIHALVQAKILRSIGSGSNMLVTLASVNAYRARRDDTVFYGHARRTTARSGGG